MLELHWTLALAAMLAPFAEATVEAWFEAELRGIASELLTGAGALAAVSGNVLTWT